MTDVQFRDLAGMAEFRAAEVLQARVWGDGDAPDPADLMMVIQAEGGLAGGAFVEGRLVGYVFGFPTATPHIQHSHRLAVVPEMRGRGLGAKLKWYQRSWCLDHGVRHVRWTFDPMRALNANLNTSCLGARSSTYYEDYYGAMGGINEGLPSDRLLVDWFLDHPNVVEKSKGRDTGQISENCIRVPLPPAIMGAASGDAQLLTARLAVRERLREAFVQGLEIVAFDPVRNDYLLLPTDDALLKVPL